MSESWPADAVTAAAEAIANMLGHPDASIGQYHRDFARMVLGAAAPAIAADLRTRLDHAEQALAGDNEGCRLWMLDCAKVATDLRARLDEAADQIDRIDEGARQAERDRILASMRLPTVMDAPRDYVAGWEAAHDRIERIIGGTP